MITVYGRATSSNVQALLWGLEELGLAYAREDRGIAPGDQDTPDFRAMTPHGLIPVLVTEDVALWETAAILRYLAGLHGHDSFWPRDPLARAQVDMWAEWAKHSVATAFTGPVFWRRARTRPENQDPALIEANLAIFEAELAKADRVLASQDYLCGPHLTLADIHIGHVLYRYFDIDIPRADFPAVWAYYLRLTERPAFQRTVMVSYDVLRNTF